MAEMHVLTITLEMKPDATEIGFQLAGNVPVAAIAAAHFVSEELLNAITVKSKAEGIKPDAENVSEWLTAIKYEDISNIIENPVKPEGEC